MDKKEYDDTDRYFDYAVGKMQDALHDLYECCSCLRYTKTAEAVILEDMIDGGKALLEHWADTIEGIRQSWCSEHYDKSWEADE